MNRHKNICILKIFYKLFRHQAVESETVYSYILVFTPVSKLVMIYLYTTSIPLNFFYLNALTPNFAIHFKRISKIFYNSFLKVFKKDYPFLKESISDLWNGMEFGPFYYTGHQVKDPKGAKRYNF